MSQQTGHPGESKQGRKTGIVVPVDENMRLGSGS
jgi:hypothetical protein